jgi:steroid 5-alpha reductase family enzyme
MSLFFFLAQMLKDNSIVDIAWGLGFVLVAWFSFFYFPEIYFRKIIMICLVSLWGLRLAGYIMIRKRGKGEDFRYQAFRKKWNRFFHLKSYLYIFIFQGFLQMIIALPIIIVNSSSPTRIQIFDFLGLVLFGGGFLFEIIADYQKYRFKKKPENKEKLMVTGLWKYSRHPNYFGESVLWWGIFLLALPIKMGWVAICSPVLISLLLVYFSGIPLLEKKYSGRKDFLHYKSITPKFFPWLPKKD